MSATTLKSVRKPSELLRGAPGWTSANSLKTLVSQQDSVY